jgi:hypothetical protein
MYQANQKILDADGNISGYEAAKVITFYTKTVPMTKRWWRLRFFNTQLNENLIINAGGSFRNLKSHNYQKLLDLLGGSYFEDIDGFILETKPNLI